MMSAGIQAWGKKVLVRYAKADYKPEQIAKAIQTLPSALLPEKRLSVYLERRNGLDTITIHKDYPIRRPSSGDIVLQQGHQQGVGSLLVSAFRRLQSGTQPKAPAILSKVDKARLKPLSEGFQENEFGTKINYFDNPARESH